MIPELRRNNIIDIIKINKNVSIEELIDKFEVSKITIRRDFDILEKRGLIEKIYGGASILEKHVSEIRYLNQIKKMVKEKRAIAVECAKRIKNEQTIFLHGGTTCLEIVKNIKLENNLKIITCFPPIVEYLWQKSISDKKNIEIFCPGGKLHIISKFYIGDHGIKFFDNIIIDIAFLGVIALNPTAGFMVTNEDEAKLLKAVIKTSKKIIAPADHTKFSKDAFIKVGLLDRISEIITDKGLKEKIISNYSKLNIKITVV